jgi:hypothetical protein
VKVTNKDTYTGPTEQQIVDTIGMDVPLPAHDGLTYRTLYALESKRCQPEDDPQRQFDPELRARWVARAAGSLLPEEFVHLQQPKPKKP